MLPLRCICAVFRHLDALVFVSALLIEAYTTSAHQSLSLTNCKMRSLTSILLVAVQYALVKSHFLSKLRKCSNNIPT